MKAKDVMTSPMVSIAPDDTVLKAVQIMLQRRVSGLPVVDKEGRLVGLVSEADLLRRTETGTTHRRSRWLEFLVGPGRLATEYAQSHGRKVSEIMTLDPVTVTEEASLEDIVKLMEKRQIKRVPVVRGEGIVGIVTRANLLHALASVAHEMRPVRKGDQTVRALLMSELGDQVWAPVAHINPMVHDGIVELWGTITDERERQALIVAAENVPGVKAVCDHLAYVDTTSALVVHQWPNEIASAGAS